MPGQLAMQGLAIGRRAAPVVEPVDRRPGRGALAQLDRGVARGVVGEPDALHGAAHAATGWAIASSRAVSAGGTAPAPIGAALAALAGGTRRWSRNSRLPSGPRIGEAIASTGSRPATSAASTTSREDAAWTAGSRTTPPLDLRRGPPRTAA